MRNEQLSSGIQFMCVPFFSFFFSVCLHHNHLFCSNFLLLFFFICNDQFSWSKRNQNWNSINRHRNSVRFWIVKKKRKENKSTDSSSPSGLRLWFSNGTHTFCRLGWFFFSRSFRCCSISSKWTNRCACGCSGCCAKCTHAGGMVYRMGRFGCLVEHNSLDCTLEYVN